MRLAAGLIAGCAALGMILPAAAISAPPALQPPRAGSADGAQAAWAAGWPAPGNPARDWFLRGLLPGYAREDLIGTFNPGEAQAMPGGIIARAWAETPGGAPIPKLGAGGRLVIELTGALGAEPMAAECMAAFDLAQAEWQHRIMLFSKTKLVGQVQAKGMSRAGFGTYFAGLKPVPKGIDRVRIEFDVTALALGQDKAAAMAIRGCRLTRPKAALAVPLGIKPPHR